MKQPTSQRALQPFGGLSQLYRELDDFFDWATGQHPAKAFRAFGLLEGNWSPAVNIYEDKDKIRVKTELPGLKKGDFEVSVQGDTLILEGERKREHEHKDKNYHRVERVYGQFHRAIALPSPVDAGGIKASYKDGILDITLPKKAETKPRQIEVEVK
ncbi:MAG: Hsp20/alpha crystallin family protein [Verrucomicrobiae bacterium]|nr:Hsp20/alpha crystallin family protein [Verrucomicrobiae bacterium]